MNTDYVEKLSDDDELSEEEEEEEEEEDIGRSIGWVLRTLWPSIRAHGGTASLLVAALTGHLVSTVALALSLETLFDEAIPNADTTQVLTTGAILLAILAGSTLAAILQARLVARLSANVVFDIQRRLYEHLLRLPASSIARTHSGDVLSRFSTDIAPVAQAVGEGGPYLVMYLLVVTGCLGAIAWIDWRAAFWTLSLFGGGALLSRGMPDLAAKATYQYKEAEARVLSLTTESIRSHVLMGVFGLREYFERRFAEVAEGQREAQERSTFRLYASEMLAEYGSMALVALTLVAGAFLTISGYVSPGALVAIFTLLVYIQEGVYEIVSSGSILVEASGGLARIQELLAENPEDCDENQPGLPALNQEIRFEDVQLSFGSNQVLSLVSFAVKRGQHVAIIGRSGSGKSTLLRLLMRLLEPDSGRITWDDLDITAFSRASLRAQLGVVFQEPLLLGRTIREAVTLEREVSDEVLQNALNAAALEDVIDTHTHGLDTPLGEEARTFSGGQKQRLALARALVRNPSILLLDEISAALDPMTEARIVATIEALPAEQTLISVTHRLQVAQHADHIIVLDNGTIAEEGNHEKLIAADGIYAALYRQQTAISVEEGGLRVFPAYLKTIPFLSQLKQELLVSLTAAFETCHFDLGSTIILQGDPAEEFFIIHRGKAEVLAGNEVVGRLQDGDCFGEMGLLFDVPRTATVRALTPVSCLRLKRDDFERFVAGDKEIETALLAIARQRGFRRFG